MSDFFLGSPFSKNPFFKQNPFSDEHNQHANQNQPKHANSAHVHASHQPAHRQDKQNSTNKARYEPKQFDTYYKPDPASFYASYGIHLKGEQTSVKCCFHTDKTPSLSINRKTGAFYCFGCGASGGDVLDFYQRYHDCDFITACKALNIQEK